MNGKIYTDVQEINRRQAMPEKMSERVQNDSAKCAKCTFIIRTHAYVYLYIYCAKQRKRDPKFRLVRSVNLTEGF